MIGPLCAFLSAVTWALGSSFYSRISAQHSAFAVNFTRAAFAFPCFVVLALLTIGPSGFSEIEPRNAGWFLISMTASYGLGDSLFLWSTHSIGIPAALAIASVYPIWTAVAGMFNGEWLSFIQWIGLVATVAGVIVVILSHGRFSAPVEKSAGRFSRRAGVLLALLTSVMWAINSYSVSQGGQDLHPGVSNALRMIFAMLLSFAFGRIFAPRASWTLPVVEWKRYSWLFFIEAFGGSFLYMYGFIHSPLAVAAVLSSLAPVISVPVAWFMGLERFSPARTAGILLVVTGVSLLMGLGTFS